MTIDKITVGSDYFGREMLHVFESADAAAAAISDSPLSDGVMMSTTTYHRAATAADIRRLKYDSHGNEIELR